jgi:cell division protein FtsB
MTNQELLDALDARVASIEQQVGFLTEQVGRLAELLETQAAINELARERFEMLSQQMEHGA